MGSTCRSWRRAKTDSTGFPIERPPWTKQPRVSHSRSMDQTVLNVRAILAGQAPKEASVTVKGWVRTRRDSKAGISFVHLSDGSSFHPVQVVAPNTLPNYADEVLKLTAGCAVEATGTIVSSPAKGQPFEMQASAIKVIGWVEDPDTYPIQPKPHTMEFLRDVAHLRPRTNVIAAATRVGGAATGEEGRAIFAVRICGIDDHAIAMVALYVHGSERVRNHRMELATPDLDLIKQVEQGARERRGRLASGPLRQSRRPERIGRRAKRVPRFRLPLFGRWPIMKCPDRPGGIAPCKAFRRTCRPRSSARCCAGC
jgi:OB-fold nucleic acid binding domain